MTTATCAPLATTSAICSAMPADDVGVDADLAAAEGLAGELEQHPVVAGVVGRLEGGGRGQRWCGVGQRVSPSVDSRCAVILPLRPASVPHERTAPLPGRGAGPCQRRAVLSGLADLEAGEPLHGQAGLVGDLLDRPLGLGDRRLLEQDEVLEEGVDPALDDLG